MQTGETSASSTLMFEDKTAGKTPLTIRCLLYFDGTLNNKGNIAEREEHQEAVKAGREGSAIYLKNRANQNKEKRIAAGAEGIDLEDDSYENDYSNIVALEINTRPEQSGFKETVIVYTEGSGTIKYVKGKDGAIGNNKDQLSGYAFSDRKSVV